MQLILMNKSQVFNKMVILSPQVIRCYGGYLLDRFSRVWFSVENNEKTKKLSVCTVKR